MLNRKNIKMKPYYIKKHYNYRIIVHKISKHLWDYLTESQDYFQTKLKKDQHHM